MKRALTSQSPRSGHCWTEPDSAQGGVRCLRLSSAHFLGNSAFQLLFSTFQPKLGNSQNRGLWLRGLGSYSCEQSRRGASARPGGGRGSPAGLPSLGLTCDRETAAAAAGSAGAHGLRVSEREVPPPLQNT